jgi:CO/xanthine dehydrogenase Mo-binding subunit
VGVVTLEHEEPEAPHGAKGVAEPPVVPVAGAIGNAVADAISKIAPGAGQRIAQIPITPEAVLRALAADRSESP